MNGPYTPARLVTLCPNLVTDQPDGLTPTWSLSSSAWSVHARATRLERCNRFRAERISLSVETTTESGHGRIQRDDIATLLSYSFLILAGNDKTAVNESIQELLADKVSVGGQAVRGNR